MGVLALVVPESEWLVVIVIVVVIIIVVVSQSQGLDVLQELMQEALIALKPLILGLLVVKPLRLEVALVVELVVVKQLVVQQVVEVVVAVVMRVTVVNVSTANSAIHVDL